MKEGGFELKGYHGILLYVSDLEERRRDRRPFRFFYVFLFIDWLKKKMFFVVVVVVIIGEKDGGVVAMVLVVMIMMQAFYFVFFFLLLLLLLLFLWVGYLFVDWLLTLTKFSRSLLLPKIERYFRSFSSFTSPFIYFFLSFFLSFFFNIDFSFFHCQDWFFLSFCPH